MRWELDWFENRARLTPEGIAVIDAETATTWNYKQLNERARSLANWLLGQGVNKGDRIALLAPNHVSYFELLFACQKIGAIFVPLNWRLSINELNDILLDCSPKFIGVHIRFEELYSKISKKLGSQIFTVGDGIYDSIGFQNDYVDQGEVELNDQDPLMIIYTGGTTGKPKGVVLSHQSILWNSMNTVLSWDLSSQDVTLTYIPMFHTGGLNALSIPLLLMGGTVVIADQFEPTKAITYLHRYRCSLVLFIPTMYHMIVQSEEFSQCHFPDIKTFLSGGAPCPLEIYDAFWEKGLPFKEGYGLSEAGPNNFYIHPNDAHNKKGSVGKPMIYNQIKLMKHNGQEASANEVGEIWIKGKHCFSSYWNNEESTNSTMKDGWLCTGDLAKKDEDGYFYIVGRKKDMIITGGENVYPLEIEQWILTHPMIDEVAVIGMPDEKWGETVTAFITLASKEVILEEELREYCSHKLGKYKIPKKFHIIEKMPKTHVGKIDKKTLKEMGLIQFQSEES